MNKKSLLILMIFWITFFIGCSSKNNENIDLPPLPTYSENEITIKAGETILEATMYDNETARNFLNTLPFTLPTIERSGLAKGVHLNDYIEYEEEYLTREYKLGEIGYWPGGDIAIFYTDDLFDKTIVDVVQIGQIKSGVEIFENYSGSVTIERKESTNQVINEQMDVKVNNQNIFGVTYKPLIFNEKLPVVIISHGYGGNYMTNYDYAYKLAELGYFTYTFDFRGGSLESRSDGCPLEMSVFTEEDDLKAVVSKILELEYIDKDRIYLLGTSQGGLVSSLVAADLVDIIKGQILLYPAFVIKDNALKMFNNKDEIPNSVHFLWMTVGKTYFEKLLDYDLYSDARRYNKKVLIIHGTEDNIVPISYSKKLEKEYSDAYLKQIDGAGHGFYGDSFDLAFGFIINYLQNN